MSENPKYKKLTPEEADFIRTKVKHGGRKSEWITVLQDMKVGDMIQVSEKLNRGTISRIGQRLNMKFSVHFVEGHYYVERIA